MKTEMTLSTNKSELKRNNKADCRLKAFAIALDKEGIHYSLSEIMLDANAITFEFLNFNKRGPAIHTVIGASQNLFNQFSMNTGVVIEHFCGQNEQEDFELICNAIENNHCVMALTDRYGLFRIFNHRMFSNISPNKHMPLHMIIIYGFDRKRNRLLICEPSTANSKYHSFWIDAHTLASIRSCEYIDLSINRDLFIIKDCSLYAKPNRETMLKMQMMSLQESLGNSISSLKDFLKFFEQKAVNDANMLRYWSIQTEVLSITTGGFDKTMRFYRGLLLEQFDEYYCWKDKLELRCHLQNIANGWVKFTNMLKNQHNQYSYQDLVNIWKDLIKEAESEQMFCKEFAIKIT